ncbi:exotoxin [Yersinia kristensenii]|nr:exotoxin [Yersinia kristensenii]MBW5843407.1 exotoxin [Yersinia kristensenii]
MSGKLTAALVAVMAALLVGVVYYHGQTVTKDSAITTVTNERDEARFILSNQVRMVNIINDIAKVNEDAKKQITLDSQRTKAGIKSDIANDDCTNRLVPVGAIDRLRAHSDKIRDRPASTNSKQLTF